MKRDSIRFIDFSYVEEKHRAIDLRLVNWSRWSTPRGASFIQPMFKGYRPDESMDDIQAQQRPLPIDPKDAARVEKGVCALPEKNREATVWAYRIGIRPLVMCRHLGVNKEGLALLIRDARTMLINRGV